MFPCDMNLERTVRRNDSSAFALEAFVLVEVFSEHGFGFNALIIQKKYQNCLRVSQFVASWDRCQRI